ncbi:MULTISPECIES: twin-arginine translocase TatA/TatE family subunit [unclassified Chryseobacterium]|jgi:sec-independent protein translocase protein TatA|uniref:twin-arginine translocase TatA/TatE family subunit n=1 Tax=unclassified Chryseobacterium TaxID=2593645 RepID=UPI001C5A626F|nr:MULTISPECIES: twin-arginine translocase TatA/TatE family subunit [unclassified Chryseobacterium]MBW3520979.1 twin-arginine translocase TatA/TatE family subunit [Chryseobacterium sp. NKUCC03_KSP]MCD0453897.1 twin-arginine translocase TatA/TatE family subunit [Chryseobacterium sp. LC2016-27]MCD0479620.1 twin-arginine translocase TatA/TatE family subunit [Chryseobacterium sp. LC2016-29]
MYTLTILALSWQHILIVAIILLLLFGGKKIPELMRGMGSGIKEFKDAIKEEDKPEAKTTENTTSNDTSKSN